jgi:hypothetical protein
MTSPVRAVSPRAAAVSPIIIAAQRFSLHNDIQRANELADLRQRTDEARRQAANPAIAIALADMSELYPDLPASVLTGAVVGGIPLDHPALASLNERVSLSRTLDPIRTQSNNILGVPFQFLRGGIRLVTTAFDGLYEELAPRLTRTAVGVSQGMDFAEAHSRAGSSTGVRAVGGFFGGAAPFSPEGLQSAFQNLTPAESDPNAQVNLGGGFLPQSNLADAESVEVQMLTNLGIPEPNAIAQVQQSFGDPLSQMSRAQAHTGVTFADGTPISPGRLVAKGFGLEVGTMPFHIVSGAGDFASQLWLDPTNAALFGLGKLRKANKALIGGTRRSTFGVGVDEFVRSPDYRTMTENLARLARNPSAAVDIKNALKLRTAGSAPKGLETRRLLFELVEEGRLHGAAGIDATFRGLPSPGGTVTGPRRSYFDTGLFESVPTPRNILSGVRGPEARTVGQRLGGSGLFRDPEARLVGEAFGLKAAVRHATEGTWGGRMLSRMPRGSLDLEDLDRGMDKFMDWMTSANFSADEAGPFLLRWARLADGDSPGAYAIYRDARKHFVTTKLDDTLPEKVLEGMLRVYPKEWDDFRAYWSNSIGEAQWFPDTELKGMFDGDTVAISRPTAHMVNELLQKEMPLDDPRELRRALGRVNGSWVSDATSTADLNARAWLNVVDGYMTKVWRPFVLLRVAWPVRIGIEEQARMAFSGLDSMFAHPFSWFSYAFGNKMNRTIVDELLPKDVGPLPATLGGTGRATVGDLRQGQFNEYGEALMGDAGWWLDFAGTSPGHKNFVNVFRDDPADAARVADAWFWNLGKLHSNPVGRYLRRNGIEDTIEWMLNGGGKAYMRQMVESGNPRRQSFLGSAVDEVRPENLRWHLESEYARMVHATGGDYIWWDPHTRLWKNSSNNTVDPTDFGRPAGPPPELQPPPGRPRPDGSEGPSPVDGLPEPQPPGITPPENMQKRPSPSGSQLTSNDPGATIPRPEGVAPIGTDALVTRTEFAGGHKVVTNEFGRTDIGFKVDEPYLAHSLETGEVTGYVEDYVTASGGKGTRSVAEEVAEPGKMERAAANTKELEAAQKQLSDEKIAIRRGEGPAAVEARAAKLPLTDDEPLQLSIGVDPRRQKDFAVMGYDDSITGYDSDTMFTRLINYLDSSPDAQQIIDDVGQDFNTIGGIIDDLYRMFGRADGTVDAEALSDAFREFNRARPLTDDAILADADWMIWMLNSRHQQQLDLVSYVRMKSNPRMPVEASARFISDEIDPERVDELRFLYRFLDTAAINETGWGRNAEDLVDLILDGHANEFRSITADHPLVEALRSVGRDQMGRGVVRSVDDLADDLTEPTLVRGFVDDTADSPIQLSAAETREGAEAYVTLEPGSFVTVDLAALTDDLDLEGVRRLTDAFTDIFLVDELAKLAGHDQFAGKSVVVKGNVGADRFGLLGPDIRAAIEGTRGVWSFGEAGGAAPRIIAGSVDGKWTSSEMLELIDSFSEVLSPEGLEALKQTLLRLGGVYPEQATGDFLRQLGLDISQTLPPGAPRRAAFHPISKEASTTEALLDEALDGAYQMWLRNINANQISRQLQPGSETVRTGTERRLQEIIEELEFRGELSDLREPGQFDATLMDAVHRLAEKQEISLEEAGNALEFVSAMGDELIGSDRLFRASDLFNESIERMTVDTPADVLRGIDPKGVELPKVPDSPVAGGPPRRPALPAEVPPAAGRQLRPGDPEFESSHYVIIDQPNDEMWDAMDTGVGKVADDELQLFPEGNPMALSDDIDQVSASKAFLQERIDKAPPVLPYPNPELSAADRGIWDKMLNTVFYTLGGGVSNKLARAPAWRQFYLRRVLHLRTFADETTARQLDEMLLGDMKFTRSDLKRKAPVPEGWVERTPGTKSSALTIQEIDQVAKGYALEETKRLLYDVTTKHNASDALRNVFPFAEAWAEIITVWSRIMFENPRVFRRAQQGVEAAREQGFFYTDGNGEEVFAYPGSEFITRALLGTGEDTEVKFTGSVAGVNLALGQYIPGFGPVAQVPVSMLVPNMPQFDTIRQLVTPFGEEGIRTPGDLLDLGLPAWFEKLMVAIGTGSSEYQRLHHNTVMDVFRILAAENPEKMNSSAAAWDLMEEASRKASFLSFVRAGAGFILPTGPSIEYDIRDTDGKLWQSQALISEYYRLLRSNDFDQEIALTEFIQRFGFGENYLDGLGVATLFTTPKTISVQERSVTETGHGWRRINGDLFEAGAYPNTAAYAMQDLDWDPFNYEAYKDGLATGAREALTPEQWLQRRNLLLGNLAYDVARERVVGRTDRASKLWLRDIRITLAGEYQGFDADIAGIPLRADTDTLVRELEAWTEDERLGGSNAGKGVAVYLELRKVMEAEAVRRGLMPDSWQSASSMRGWRDWLRSASEKIMAVYPEFGQLWFDVFRRELNRDESPEPLTLEGLTF